MLNAAIFELTSRHISPHNLLYMGIATMFIRTAILCVILHCSHLKADQLFFKYMILKDIF